MAEPSSCPPEHQLRQLLAGQPSDEFPELVAHLDHCMACQRRLDRLAADPLLLGAVSALRLTLASQEAPLRRLLDGLVSNNQRTLLYSPTHDRTAWVQSLLQPTDSAEGLGTLGQYEVTEVLGQGGMGVVLKALDPDLKRWVALKVLAPDLAGDPVARERFAREARAAAAVRHAHVIAIHAVDEAAGLPFIVMEYVAGGSLQDWLDRHGPPDWRDAARLGAEVASGLAAAHARGLVHRDIKPSNILLQTEGVAAGPGSARICDFGLAHVADESRLTRTGVVTGTPMYMSPEQAQGSAVDERADLFSLGSVMYALCTGREPFANGSPMAVIRQVAETTPRPIRDFNPAAPAWLAAIVARLHAKRPADRFASAAQVADLLHYNLAHPDRPRPVPQPRRTRRRLAAAVALATLLALLVTLSEALRWTHLTGWRAAGDVADAQLPLRATLRGHAGPVWSVTFAPDGQTLATGSDDSTLRFWNAASGRETAVLPANGGAVLAVAFAHGGQFLASGGGDGTLRLWDVATRQQRPPAPHLGGSLRRLAISPDDKTIAVGSGTQGVALWNVADHTIHHALPGHQGTVLALAFAPDGQTLATGDTSGSIRLWDPATGTERTSFIGDPLGLRALAFTPDSQTLVSTGTGDRGVKVWNVATQQLIATLPGPESGLLNLAIGPDGQLLAAGGRDGFVSLWNLPAAQPVVTLHAHQGNVWSVAFSPDGRTLATAGEDRLGKLWNLDKLAEMRP